MQDSRAIAGIKPYVGREVKLIFSDGEVAVGKLVCVLEDEGAIVFDLVTSNRPDKYERSDVRPSLWANLSDIVRYESPTAGAE